MNKKSKTTMAVYLYNGEGLVLPKPVGNFGKDLTLIVCPACVERNKTNDKTR